MSGRGRVQAGAESLNGESEFYRFLMKTHRMPKFATFTCDECGNNLLEYEDRYHCLECDNFDLCPDCARKPEFKNCPKHLTTHRHEIIAAGKEKEKDEE